MPRDFGPCVYIMASQHNGALYIGVTSDLIGLDNLGWRDLAEVFGLSPLRRLGPCSCGDDEVSEVAGD